MAKGSNLELSTSVLDTASSKWNAMLIDAFPRRSKKKSKLRCPCRNSKCKYNVNKAAEGFAEHTTAVAEKLTRIEPPPPPPKGRLILEFISTIERLNLRFSWCGFLPSRIGRNVALDAAARAIIEAHKFRNRGNRANADRECQSYLQAVRTLRTEIDSSDDSLATVALLTLREQILGKDVESIMAHDDGIAAILLARSPTTPVSELSRSILFECCRIAKTGRPCATGEPSPFQGTSYEDLEPAFPFSGTTSSEALVLRKLSHKLSIRFPGLIAAVRRVRSGIADDDEARNTVALARELFDVKDDVAEKGFLSNLKPAMTLNKLDRALIPMSFQFRSPNEIAVALSYWTARIVVVRCCIFLLSTKHAHLFAAGEKSSSYTLTMLLQDEVRIATSILMSWQYSSQHKLMVLLMPPLKIIWDVFTSERSHSPTGKSPIQSWLLDRFHEFGWPMNYGEKEMDEISPAFAGGPITPAFRMVAG